MHLPHSRSLAVMAMIIICVSSFTPALGTEAHTHAPPAAVPMASPLFWHIPPLNVNTAPGRITSAVFDPLTPGLVLAGPGNPGSPILRSSDAGANWSSLTSWAPSDERFPYRIAYGEAERTFYAYGGVSVYRTSDGGESWSQVPYPGICNQISALIVSPADTRVLYAGAMNGFARSTDGGATWNVPGIGTNGCLQGPPAHTAAASATRPQVVYAGLFYNYGGGVQRSDDFGETWQDVSGTLPFNSPGGARISIVGLAVDPRDDQVVWALTEDGRLYRTSNGGAQWSWISAGLGDTQLVSFTLAPQHGYRVYAVSTAQAYMLADAALQWQVVDVERIPQRSSFPPPFRLAVDPADPARLVLTGDDGIYVALEQRSGTAAHDAVMPSVWSRLVRRLSWEASTSG